MIFARLYKILVSTKTKRLSPDSSLMKLELGESQRCPLCSYWLIRILCLSKITEDNVLCECCVNAFMSLGLSVLVCVCMCVSVCALMPVGKIYGVHNSSRLAT